jgi:hypothetical protein
MGVQAVEDLQTSRRIGLVLAAIMLVCFTLSAIALP